jgi:2-keto-myo-inositol isomerase
MMKFSLNGATTMNADLATDVRAAKAAGFDGLEIWAAKLREYLKTHSLEELNQLFIEHEIEPYSINSIERITFQDAAGAESITAQCVELCNIAHAIKCPYVVVVPGYLPHNATPTEIVEESVHILNELAEIAERFNVKLAFEFLGQTDCSVQTLEVAQEIVEKVNRLSIGLVIDSFHFYAGGSSLASIEALDPQRLFIFHINDAEDLPRESLEDRHRLLPGLGILPLPEMLAACKRIKYNGVVSVEIFRPEYWQRDPFELAKAARAAIDKVFKADSSST